MKKILIVDDCEEVRLLLKAVLESGNHETIVASTGKEAFDFLQDNPVDLIISDLEMPDGDGDWLLKKSRSLENPPPVIIMSGKVMVDVESLIFAGATAFFSKPFPIPELLESIHLLWEKSSGQA